MYIKLPIKRFNALTAFSRTSQVYYKAPSTTSDKTVSQAILGYNNPSGKIIWAEEPILNYKGGTLPVCGTRRILLKRAYGTCGVCAARLRFGAIES